jgi:hypothetical protein
MTTYTNYSPHNPYEAQKRYAELLFAALEVSWWHPFKKARTLDTARRFQQIHELCCEWAREKENKI